MNFFKEIYDYREMIYSLVRKDLRGRYKSSALGFLWTFINPLLQLLIYTLVFDYILPQEIDKYYLHLFVALIPWIFFSAALTSGAVSVVNSKDLVNKIYFPRAVLPISYVTSAFVNMLLCFIVIFIVILFSGIGFNLVALLTLPVIMLVEYVLCLGVAMLTSALTVYFRDLEYILGIISMAWIYMTPVMYSVERVPEYLLPIYNLNPMTPIIVAFREVLYFKRVPQLSTLLQAFLLGLIILAAGILVFQKLQKHFAEEL